MSEVKWTRGPWRLEVVQKFPFGVTIWAGDWIIMRQDAICFATGQKSRRDNETGLGFERGGATERAAAEAAIAEQDATAHLITAAPELYYALAEAALQLEYLHEKFTETGSGNAVLARIRDVMAKARGEGTER